MRASLHKARLACLLTVVPFNGPTEGSRETLTAWTQKNPCAMLTFFKINHEHCLEWKDATDVLTFIVVVEVVATSDRGFSTHIMTNERRNSVVTKKCITSGRSTIKVMSQFDVALETGTIQFSPDMPVIGFNALGRFLARDKLPFFHSGPREVLTGNRRIGSEELGPASPKL